MRKLVAVAFVLAAVHSFAQDRGQFWMSVGAKREVADKVIVSVGTNARWNNDGSLRTLYQEACVKSEHLKWFRPSLEYRLVTSYDKLHNYSNAHRYNLNLDFRTKVSDFKLGTRLRYQGYLGGGTGSGSDLDPSYRIKPYVEWSNKSRFAPELSAEWFYDPIPSPVGNRFNRVRYGLTCSIDLPGPNDLGVTYYYGRKFNTGNPYNEHIFSLEYTFDWKANKK